MFDSASFLPDQHPIERRARRRQRSYLAGTIVMVGVGVSISCTIRNLSPEGAKITVKGLHSWPDDPLLIVVRYGIAHETSTIWVAEADVGFSFVRSHDLTDPAPSHLLAAQMRWAEQRLG